jgi:hypothetical protein
MNENKITQLGPEDAAVLGGLRRRMADVERLVPAPPAWKPAREARLAESSHDAKIRVRALGAFGFGGVLVAMVVAGIIGLGLSGQGPRGNGGQPTAAVRTTTLMFELQPVNGTQPTQADLAAEVEVVQRRADSVGAGIKATAVPPKQVKVVLPAGADAVALGQALSQVGKLEFVELPRLTYGYMDTSVGTPVSGTKDLPSSGQAIDPSLSQILTGAGLDPSSVSASLDTAISVWSVNFSLTPTAKASFATWSSANIGSYFAIVVDGNTLEVPYIVSPITDGRVELAGNFTEAEARRLATLLKSGELTFPLVALDAVTASSSPTHADAPQPVVSPSAESSASPAPTGAPDASGAPLVGYLVYVSQAGDTPQSIADAQGITLDQLLAANPDLRSQSFVPEGTQVLIPQSTGPGATPITVPTASS